MAAAKETESEKRVEEMLVHPPHCPHCDSVMERLELPDGAKFASPYIYVCFNDECGYYKRGWEWMESHFGHHSSYRYKLDPFTGETGPIPVWSEGALRNHIMDEGEK